jgi:hypothetical protein
MNDGIVCHTGTRNYKDWDPDHHSAAALQRWICDLHIRKALKALLLVALPVLISQLTTLTLRA